MGPPRSVEEFECMISRLIEGGAFDSAGSRSEFRQALQETVRAIQAAHHVQPSLSACERLVGSLFVRAIEQSVHSSQNVTLLMPLDSEES